MVTSKLYDTHRETIKASNEEIVFMFCPWCLRGATGFMAPLYFVIGPCPYCMRCRLFLLPERRKNNA